MSQIGGKLEGKAREFRSRPLFSGVSHNQLFPSDVILHFSYHKCLTGYFNNVMGQLSKEFGFDRSHFQSRVDDFENAVLGCKKKSILSVNNSSDLRFDAYPSYKGSHFVRDPRDLIVSGYRYHLWTKEAWCINPSFDWTSIVKHPYFAKYVESQQENFPFHTSYQDYLNRLDYEKGMILELLWRQEHFSQLQNWNFDNPNIIEKRYEDIIGNEHECFDAIFSHYNFHPKLMRRGLELIEQYSLENRKKSKKGHVRKGTAQQWVSEFTPLHKELFKQLNGELLVVTGYEQDLCW